MVLKGIFMCYFQFGLYFFSFLLTESVINDRAVTVVGIDSVNLVYAIGLLCTALGYFIFPYIYSKIKKELLFIFCTTTIISAILLVTIDIIPLFLLTSYICLISFGYIGGYVHYNASVYMAYSHFSIKMGISMAIAIFIQYLVQLINGNNIVFVVSIIISSCLVFITNKYSSNNVEENTHDYIPALQLDSYNKSLKKLFSKKIIISVLMVVIMSMILGIEDSIMVYKNAKGELSLFSGIRLMYSLGLLVAAIIADIKNRLYLPFASVCSIMLSTLVITFLDESSINYNLGMGFMYFYSGFYVIYLTLVFMDISRHMNNSRLFAGLGRIVRSITTSFVVILFIVLSDILSHSVCTVINCFLSILTIVIFYFDVILNNKANNDISIEKETADFSNKENSDNFCNYYNFTDKEKESFVLLISTEDTVQNIADSMGISRRVLQRYITSMYEKTNTQTRVGLLMSYISYLNEKKIK